MDSVISMVQTDMGFAAIFSAVATFAAVLLTHWLRGKVNLITYSPNSTFFQLHESDDKTSAVTIRSGQVFIQNLGRKSARNVQITSVPGVLPSGYVVLPSLVHSTHVGPNGEWILQIPFIAPKELITLQLLNGPNIDSVRSEDGIARAVPVIHQRVMPRWLNTLVVAVMVFGLLSFFYVIGIAITSI